MLATGGHPVQYLQVKPAERGGEVSEEGEILGESPWEGSELRSDRLQLVCQLSWGEEVRGGRSSLGGMVKVKEGVAQ